MRLIALLIAAALAVPAAIALLLPRRAGDDADGSPRRALDGVWAVVPAALLVVLGVLAATA